MPTTNVPRKILLIHGNVIVFHDYKYDESDINDPLTYHYSFDENGENIFDVRELPNPDNLDDHKAIIRRALDEGDLQAETAEPELLKRKSLSGGQHWLLTSVYGIDSPSSLDDTPDLSPLEEEVLRRSATVDDREGVLSLHDDMLLSIDALFGQYAEK